MRTKFIDEADIDSSITDDDLVFVSGKKSTVAQFSTAIVKPPSSSAVLTNYKVEGISLYNIFDQFTGEPITAKEVTTRPDGVPVTDPDVDNITYFKAGTKYYKRSKDIYSIKDFGASGKYIPGITGTILAASNQLTLSSSAGYEIGEWINIAGAGTDNDTYQTLELLLTSFPSSNGNVILTLDGVNYNIPVLTTQSWNDIAKTICELPALTLDKWYVTKQPIGLSCKVLFRSALSGVRGSHSWNSNSTGAVGAFRTLCEGAVGTSLITTIVGKTGNILTLSTNAARNASTVKVLHDDDIPLKTALRALSPDGGTILFPRGTYTIATTYIPKAVVFLGEDYTQSTLRLRTGVNNDLLWLDNRSYFAKVKQLTLDGNCGKYENGVYDITRINNSWGRGIAIYCGTDRSSKFGSVNPLSLGLQRNERQWGQGEYTFFDLQSLQIMFCADSGLYVQPYAFSNKFNNIYSCFNEGYGIENYATDNQWYSIDTEGNKLCGIVEYGANNKWIIGKHYFNNITHRDGSNAADRQGAITVYGAGSTFQGQETQDNFGHGYMFIDCKSAIVSGCLADGNGYTSESVSTSTGLAAGFKLVNSQNITIDGISRNYRFEGNGGIASTGKIQQYPFTTDTDCKNIRISLIYFNHLSDPILLGTDVRFISQDTPITIGALRNTKSEAVNRIVSVTDYSGFLSQFYWDDSSTTADDNFNVIQPTGVTTGRWKRVGIIGSNITANDKSGVDKGFTITTNNLARWTMMSNNESEGEDNAGSNLIFGAWNDDGSFNDVWLGVNRETRVANFSKVPTVGGVSLFTDIPQSLSRMDSPTFNNLFLGGSTTSRLISLLKSNVLRWQFGYDEAESGSNTGAKFVLARFADNAAYIDTPFSVHRDTGVVEITSLELTGTTKAYRGSRMTSTQIAALTGLVAGDETYNLTTNKKNIYNGTSWEVVTSV